MANKELISERNLWKSLGLPRLDSFIVKPPKGPGCLITPPPLLDSHGKHRKGDLRSVRFTRWIELGLPYTSNHGERYFNTELVESFLQDRYGITVAEFKRAHAHMRNHGDAITAIFTD